MKPYRRIIILSFLIYLILSPHNLFLAHAREPSTAQSLLEEGVSLLNAGKFNEAIKALKEYSAFDPDNYLPYYYMGASYAGLGDIVSAKDSLEKSIKLKPDFVPAHIGLGELYEMGKRPDLAKKEYETIIAISKEPGDIKTAKDRMTRINRIMAGEHIKVAERLAAEGKVEDAIKELQDAEGLTPENVRIPILLATLYIRLERYKEAIEAYKKAEALIPQNPEIHMRLAKLYYSRNEYKEAIEEFNEVIRLSPGSAMAGDAAQIMKEVESRLKGRDYFAEAAKALEENRLDDALSASKKILEIEPNNSFAYFNLGVIYKKKKMYNEAIAALNKSLELSPDYVAAQYQLGVIYDDQGMYSEAVREYDAVVSMGKEDTDDTKKATERSRLLKEVLMTKEGEERMRALIAGGDIEGALREAGKISAVTNNDKTLTTIGQIFLLGKVFDKSIDTLGRAIKINPRNWEAYIILGQAYEGKRLFKEARPLYSKVASSVPDTKEGKDAKVLLDQLEIKIHFIDATEYKKKGDMDGALREVQAVLEQTPDDPVALYNAGVLYYMLELPDKAVTVLTHAIQKQPDYVQAHLQMALVYERMQKYEDATAEFKTVLSLTKEGRDADIAKARLGLLKEEQVLSTHMKIVMELIGKGKFEQALDEAKTIIIVAPENYIAQYTIGFIYDRLDMLDEAKTAYQKAVEINPKYARAHFGLARVYERMGLYNDSRESYQKTVSTGEGTSEAEMALIALERLKRWHMDAGMSNTINIVTSPAKGSTTSTVSEYGVSFGYDIFNTKEKGLNITTKLNQGIYYESQKTMVGYNADIKWNGEFRKNHTYSLSTGYSDVSFDKKPYYKSYRYSLSNDLKPGTIPTSISIRLDYVDTTSFTNKLLDITQYTLKLYFYHKTSDWDGVLGSYNFISYFNKAPLASNFAYRSDELSLRYTKRLLPDFTVGGEYNGKLVNYMNPDSTTLFTQFRRNISNGAGVDMTYRLSDKGSIILKSTVNRETTNLPSLTAENIVALGEKLANPIPRVGGWKSSQTVNVSVDTYYRLSEKIRITVTLGKSWVATEPRNAGSYNKLNMALSLSAQF